MGRRSIRCIAQNLSSAFKFPTLAENSMISAQLNELVSHQSTALQLLMTLPIDAASTENGEGGPSPEELKSQACSLLLDSFGSIQRVTFATPAQILQRTPLSRACAAEIGAFFDKDA
jgi:hypothetical protein